MACTYRPRYGSETRSTTRSTLIPRRGSTGHSSRRSTWRSGAPGSRGWWGPLRRHRTNFRRPTRRDAGASARAAERPIRRWAHTTEPARSTGRCSLTRGRPVVVLYLLWHLRPVGPVPPATGSDRVASNHPGREVPDEADTSRDDDPAADSILVAVSRTRTRRVVSGIPTRRTPSVPGLVPTS